MASVIIKGYVGNDLEKKSYQDTVYVKFSVSEPIKTNEDGTKEYQYIDCIAWGTQADIICANYQKSSFITVLATITTKKVTDESSQKNYKLYSFKVVAVGN